MDTNQLQFIFMFHGSRRGQNLEFAARSQEDVAKELGISQGAVARIEQSAFRKLRSNPEVKRLMRHFSQMSSAHGLCSVEPQVMRKFDVPEDASYLTITGFSPNV